LFDLEADPGERQNVIDDPHHAAQLTALRARLTDLVVGYFSFARRGFARPRTRCHPPPRRARKCWIPR
jgi:hypothetical protein